MSCGTELYLPIQDVEGCTGITQDRAIPVVVKGIIYTKKCPDGVVEYDREKVVMCEKNTGAKVLVESWSDVNDPTQAITKRYTYLVGNTLFVGNPDTDLVDCGSEKLDIQTKQYCDNGETVWGTLVWDVSELTPALIGIVFNKIDASIHTPISPVEGSCEVIIANRQIPVIEDCTLATTPTDVNGKIAEEVILGGSTKVIPVRIQENCIEPSLRDVIIDTDCVGTDETVQVEGNIQEVILHPSQAIKVVVDKSCETQLTADVPNCAGTTDPKPVDEITATYLLNQENKHTERLYDNITATLTGTVTAIIAGTNVLFDFTGVVDTNRVGANYLADFGNGFSDFGSSPSRDYANEPDGNYEIKIYRGFVFPEGIRHFLVSTIEIIVSNGSITVSSTNPIPVNRSITYTQKEVLQDYCNGVLIGVPYIADGSVATINGTLSLTYREELTEWLGEHDANNTEECNLFPITNCFCAMVSGSTTRKETTEKAKATSTSPVKATICETLRYDCKQVVKAKTYTIAGKPYTALQFAGIKYTKIECNAPTPTYSAGAVTCTTYPDPIDGTIVLNATVYTNDSNPSDVQTVYTLASNYPTVGNIGDLYIVADEDLLVDCPPGSIIETELCYKALVDIKGIAVAGDTINIQSIENVTAGTTRYTIKHVGSGAIIYAGVDPLTDIGIDPNAMNPAEWNVTPCVPTTVVYGPIDTKEICAFVNGGTQQYCLTRVFSRHPQTGVMTILHYEDSQGNIIDGDVVETCCDGSAVCYQAILAPIANRKGNSYGASFGHSTSDATFAERVFTDDGAYDILTSTSGYLPGSPRNHYYMVRVFDGAGNLVSTTQLGGYGIDISGATYNQFLSDLSALTSQFGVTFTDTHPNNTSSFGFEMEYNDTTYFGITFEHGFDNHAGGIDWNPRYRSAIKYESGDAQPFDSISNFGDLNNPFADAGFRERTTMFLAIDLQNIVVI